MDGNPAKNHLAILGPTLTVAELARYLRVHTSTIYRLIERNELPAFRVGRNWRFNLKDIDELQLVLSIGPKK